MFDALERIADAVLYEGYVLYPYRASSTKNQFRWQFGVVAPRPSHDEGEPWFAQTECLVESAAATAPRLMVRVRFLRARETPIDAGRSRGPWLEGVPHAIDLEPIDLDEPGLTDARSLAQCGIDARLTIRTERAEPFTKVQLRLENLEPWREAFARDRDAMLLRSLAGAHLLLGIDGGAFVSLLEPPDSAAAAVASCRNVHAWPVLAGDRARRDLMLSSPIVLYDHPAVAKESPGDLCDAAEIDEILSLRILTMTDDEKQEARATDPRARAILDRVEALTPDGLAALHGTMRSADFFNPPGTPPPDEASVTVGTWRIAKGSRVRLRPNRRADAIDMFLVDQAATVAGVYRDVDERVYLAVTVDADPGASLHESFGRFFYFDPTEVERIDQSEQERV
jgi:hypothetical protein